MAISFPSSIDSFTNPSASSDTAVLSHASQHDNANDAITALENKVGVNSSAVTTSIDYLLKNTSSVDPGHKHTLTTSVTGTLPVANGGTGSTTLTSGEVLLGAGTSPITSVGTSGSGNIARVTSPAFTTPSLGAATATSINGLTISSSSGTLTITNSKTLAATNTLTLSGTDSTVMTFPSTTATIARTDAAQTFTGSQTFTQVLTTNNAIAAVSNAATVPITSRINTVTNSSAATLTITMTTTSATDGQLSEVRIKDFSGVAQTITWVNTEDSTVTAPTTSNGSTTLPLSVIFQYNSATSKWRTLAKA